MIFRISDPYSDYSTVKYFKSKGIHINSKIVFNYDVIDKNRLDLELAYNCFTDKFYSIKEITFILKALLGTYMNPNKLNRRFIKQYKLFLTDNDNKVAKLLYSKL